MDLFVALRTFVRVVDLGSFAQAAAAVGLSAPMIGRYVRALEDHLGVQLLARTTRTQSLTEAGRIFYDAAKTVLGELSAAEESVARMQTVPRGVLRVDAPVTFGCHMLAPALADFHRENPHVEVHLTLNNRVVDLVEEGYDAVIRGGSLADSSLVARTLVPYRIVVCAAKSYLRLHGRPRVPADLTRHACLRFRGSTAAETWVFADGAGRSFSVRVTGPLVSNNGEALRAAAVNGLGIVAQPESLLAADLATGRLERVLPRFEAPELPLHVVYSAVRPPPPKLRAFLDFVARRFGPRPHHLSASRGSHAGHHSQ